MAEAQYSPPLNRRRAGVLLHISSLPGAGEVGDLGMEAYRFVDFLQAVGASVWQTLPINMPHADNSPYQCLSAFAGNTDFIDLTALASQNLLSTDDMYGNASRADLLTVAYHAYSSQASTELSQDYADFCRQQAYWLSDFSLFLALRNQFKQAGWRQWPEAYKNRDAHTLKQACQDLATEIAVIEFAQYLFFSQWQKLKRYAASKNVYLFGDIPIFVAYDSADVWAKAALFKLDANKNMAVVAGVPPDYFSVTGQRWGNPHYDWQAMAADNYAWWIARMAMQNTLFDVVRIDHFRGLQAAWEIPVDDATAINGHWALAPGVALLTAIKQVLPKICLVAEDLGIITDEVNHLRLHFQLPGMKILQFAFGGDAEFALFFKDFSE
ncbi:MAG: 4-alpha-glucanotransferase, partial [Methylotenera sp.]|nr:4-alpha-glucanotransferase [Methylotenera sp.]